MKIDFFILDSKPDPWGDYGDLLMHGMGGRLDDNDDGMLQLERAGPFIPPISLPGLPGIVVTAEFRKDIEQSSLTGFEFRPIEKTHIVSIPWHDGSRDSEEPLHYPEGGEPENYILRLPHHNGLALQFGDLWELAPKDVCYTTRKSRIVNSRDEITLVTEGWDGSDIFRADGVLYNYVSLKARDWFAARVSELLVFHDAITSPTPPTDQLRA